MDRIEGDNYVLFKEYLKKKAAGFDINTQNPMDHLPQALATTILKDLINPKNYKKQVGGGATIFASENALDKSELERVLRIASMMPGMVTKLSGAIGSINDRPSADREVTDEDGVTHRVVPRNTGGTSGDGEDFQVTVDETIAEIREAFEVLAANQVAAFKQKFMDLVLVIAQHQSPQALAWLWLVTRLAKIMK